MCYNVSTKKVGKLTEKQFKAKFDSAILPSGSYYLSGFSHPLVPVISNLNPSLITEFNWGLILSFCKTEMDAKSK